MRISDWSSDVCSSDLWGQDELLHETLIKGVNDEHLAVTIDRLKQRYGVVVDTRRPSVAYKESVRKPVTHRGRHKKQSGGHGQRPAERRVGKDGGRTGRIRCARYHEK